MPPTSRVSRRWRPGPVLVALVCAMAWGGPRAAWPQAAIPQAAVRWDGVEHVIAFADVHGAYTELLALLHAAGVLDAQDRWAAGRTHVVSLGDLLDRGADSRKVLDLLMRLQGEAQAAGGQLHVLLGDHEAMNLLGDLRYVTTGEFASYADLESPATRAAALKAWQARPCAGSCPAFDEQYPPGYFGHRAAFSPQGRYGQWLLAQPVAIVINDTLFMHGGASQVLQGMSLQELNLRYRTALLGALQRGEIAPEDPLLADLGPNWYRGEALCHEATETDTLSPLLRQFGVARLVIGHTPTRNGRVLTRFDGRVVKLDTGMNYAVFRGRPSALIIEPTGLNVRYAGEPGLTPPQPEGLFVAPQEVDEGTMLAALRDGEVSVTGPRGPDELEVAVRYAGRSLPAVFEPRAADAARREVAAWRLDRLIGLGIVPATVEREVQGRHGVLQGRPLRWITEVEARQPGRRGSGWCTLAPQYQLLYALDTLSGNEDRSAASMVYDAENWFVYATSFGHAFGTSRRLPGYLAARPPAPGAELRRRLAALNATDLEAALGSLLDERARGAILARRDALLALPAAAERPL